MSRKNKRLALECILIAMETVRRNIEIATRDESVMTNTEAMEHLANAYSLIERGNK